jgi:maltooligosyltrehalose trehalohydrolase
MSSSASSEAQALPEEAARRASAPAGARLRRSLPVGAECQRDGGVHFRVWAPRRKQVRVVMNIDGTTRELVLTAEGNGYFSGLSGEAGAGTLYRFQLDADDALYPDPASRFQPEGPFGPSRVVDPAAFRWSDSGWAGAMIRGQVIYEMHIGTFTPERHWTAAARELPELARLGVTCLEMMPIAEFAGRFGWGYDGVDLFAPSHLYGEPDDVRRFLDEAHRHGLAVILDVVYNHLGPDGNYLAQFSPDYFTDRYHTEWGEPLNFDGPESGPVREFFLANARAWIEEYHFDGLRLDATQSIFDESPEHILAALAHEVRAAARGRATMIVAENEPQHTRLVRPVERGGYGLDGLWNDDLHHSMVVALTGKGEAYYTDYGGSPQELISAAKWGYLYQGQRYKWQRRRRGTPALDLPPETFVNFLENHDQVANSVHGRRLHQLTSPGRYRALTAYLLLAPATPMLFQGQEFASSAPFHYFADHQGELGRMVREGRTEFLAQFRSIATPEMMAALPDATAVETFERCTLDLAERERHGEIYQLHADLLSLRRTDPVLSAQRPRSLDGAVLGAEAFVLRFFGDEGADRLLLVNLGADLALDRVPEPLLAPPESMLWRIAWSSDDVRYGGAGIAPVETRQNWRLPGHAAVLLEPRPAAGVDDPASGDGEETEEAEVRREALRQSERGQ